jgi:hypothetical protein
MTAAASNSNHKGLQMAKRHELNRSSIIDPISAKDFQRKLLESSNEVVKATGDESSISDVIHELADRAAWLEDVVVKLTHALDPVLIPTISAATEKVDLLSNVPLAACIQEQSNRFRDSTRKLSDLLDHISI